MNQGLSDFADYLGREANSYEIHGVSVGIKSTVPAVLRKLSVQAKLRAVAEKDKSRTANRIYIAGPMSGQRRVGHLPAKEQDGIPLPEECGEWPEEEEE